jgi:enoyl-CoA hydratase
MAEPVRLERLDRVAVVTLDRADRLNAIGTDTVAALAAAVEEVAADPSLGALVLTGQGRAFSAGADISEFAQFKSPAQFEAFIRTMADTFGTVRRLAKPSVAAINGAALGGGFELALACDLRIAAAGARLGVPEIKLGLLPGAGGTALLTRMLPPGAAKQLLLTGDPITAQDAFRLGLVNEIAEDGASAVSRAVAIADHLAALPAGALAGAKHLVDDGAELSLAAATVLERDTVSRLFATSDREEGVAAFLDKRPPRFDNRRN